MFPPEPLLVYCRGEVGCAHSARTNEFGNFKCCQALWPPTSASSADDFSDNFTSPSISPNHPILPALSSPPFTGPALVFSPELLLSTAPMRLTVPTVQAPVCWESSMLEPFWPVPAPTAANHQHQAAIMPLPPIWHWSCNAPGPKPPPLHPLWSHQSFCLSTAPVRLMVPTMANTAAATSVTSVTRLWSWRQKHRQQQQQQQRYAFSKQCFKHCQEQHMRRRDCQTGHVNPLNSDLLSLLTAINFDSY